MLVFFCVIFCVCLVTAYAERNDPMRCATLVAFAALIGLGLLAHLLG